MRACAIQMNRYSAMRSVWCLGVAGDFVTISGSRMKKGDFKLAPGRTHRVEILSKSLPAAMPWHAGWPEHHSKSTSSFQGVHYALHERTVQFPSQLLSILRILLSTSVNRDVAAKKREKHVGRYWEFTRVMVRYFHDRNKTGESMKSWS